MHIIATNTTKCLDHFPFLIYAGFEMYTITILYFWYKTEQYVLKQVMGFSPHHERKVQIYVDMK